MAVATASGRSTGELLLIAVFAGVLLLLAAVDLRDRRVPNVIVFPALLAAIVVGPAGAAAAVAGAVAGLAVFGGLAWLGGRRYPAPPLGMGDVKLAMLLGAIVGWPNVGAALLLGMVLAGLAALALLAGRVVDRQATMPYGSFLALAGVVVLLITITG